MVSDKGCGGGDAEESASYPHVNLKAGQMGTGQPQVRAGIGMDERGELLEGGFSGQAQPLAG